MKQVWCEKYRPKSVARVIMTDDRTRKIFAKFVQEEQIPNIMMYGGPGTGKTSMSLALLHDLNVQKADILRINCSDEHIDALRDKVKGFATTMAMGNFKIVQLEEIDFLPLPAQALLRSLIEDVSDSCRFIGTCNYINKLTPPLRSRFQEFSIRAPAREDVIVLAAEILEAEAVDFDIDDLEKIIAAAYPDVRKIIQLLEGSVIGGKLSLAGSSDQIYDWKLDLIDCIDSSDLKAARKVVCESATKEELQDVFRFLFDNIHRAKKLSSHVDDAIVLIAEYQYKHAFVADPEINIAALFISIEQLTR